MRWKLLLPALWLTAAVWPLQVEARRKPAREKVRTESRAKKGKESTLRVLYWNIQDGMWAGQEDDYTAFVEWVDSRQPDICIWCEAQTRYKTGTRTASSEKELFLPEGWGKLARRYGHKYVSVGDNRSGCPQVITSRFPIREEERLRGSAPDSVLTHGALAAVVRYRKDVLLHLVALHTSDYPPLIVDGAVADGESGGEACRRREVEYVCNHTIGEDVDAGRHFWLMAGDFNAVSRRDNEFYRLPEEDERFAVHDYMTCQTSFCDAVAEFYAGELLPTVAGLPLRTDFVYCTQALLERMTAIGVVDDGYTHPVKDATNAIGCFRPSDHLPIVVDFDMSETED